MKNNTDLIPAHFYRPEFVTEGIRTYSVIILLENLIVSACLYTHKGRFYKRDFWLLLVCVNISDILMGIASFVWSFIESDIFSKNIYACSFMVVTILSSWISLMYNIMCACVHRIILKFGGDKMRFGWRTKMTLYQVTGVFIFSVLYMMVPFVLWLPTEQQMTSCEPEQLFGQNLEKAYVFIGIGALTPLLPANISYGCLTYLKQTNAKQMSQPVHMIKCELRATPSMIDFEPSDDDETQIVPDVMTLSYDNEEEEIVALGVPQNNISDPLRYLNLENGVMNVRGQSNLETSLFPNKDTYEGERYTFSQLPDIQKQVERESLNQKDKRLAKTSHRKGAEYSTCMARHGSPGTARRNRDISNETQRMVDAQNQIIGLIGIVLLLENFIILPNVLILFFIKFIPQTPNQVIEYILGITATTNAFVHPWIYAYQSKEFREALTSIITGLIHAVCPCLRQKSDRKADTPNVDCRYD